MTVLDDRYDTHTGIEAHTGQRRHFDPGLARTETLGVTETRQHVSSPSLERRSPFERTAEYPVVRVDSGGGSGADAQPFVEGHHDDKSSTGTAQLVASVVLPGAASWRRNPLIAALLLVLGVAAPTLLLGAVYVQRSKIVGLALDPTFLLVVMTIGVLAVAARVVAIGEVAIAHRFSPGIEMRTVGALLITAVLTSPVMYAVAESASARSAMTDVFNSDSDAPLFVPESASMTAAVLPWTRMPSRTS